MQGVLGGEVLADEETGYQVVVHLRPYFNALTWRSPVQLEMHIPPH